MMPAMTARVHWTIILTQVYALYEVAVASCQCDHRAAGSKIAVAMGGRELGLPMGGGGGGGVEGGDTSHSGNDTNSSHLDATCCEACVSA